MDVISIVPRLAPAIDGVGDYALRLAGQLRHNSACQTHFIVGDPDWQSAATVEGFVSRLVIERSPMALRWQLCSNSQRSPSVLLHYVTYGYAQRGCPEWLVSGLEQWKTDTPNARLVTMFHEIYHPGPPWRRNFWVSPQQKHLARRLLQLSDRVLTSIQDYASILQHLSPVTHPAISTLPIFSNIGEPESVLPLASRPKRLVIFGQSKSRQVVYTQSAPALQQACQQLGIEEIWDIGPPTGLAISSIQDIPVVMLGQRSPSEVSHILANALAGFIRYEPNRLGKSGIFAAYCAHGLLPISHQTHKPGLDGLTVNQHYWTVENREQPPKSMDDWQAIATRAFIWYQQHTLTQHAKTFAQCFLSMNEASPTP